MKKVSVIVLTYNASWEKLKATIRSILAQEEIDYEIIIADDGSAKNWEEELTQLLEGEGVPYTFAFLPENSGTVKNVCSALAKAEGEYIKLIAPGDFLYDRKTLSCWVQFMDTRESQVSFGDAVYYDPSKGLTQIAAMPAPANRALFALPQNREDVFVNYLLANDTILGASVLMRADLMRQYLQLIEGRVKYAEDYMLRLIIFDHVPVHYYHAKTIWYEYGTGISTGKESEWTKRLQTDLAATDEILKERGSAPDAIARKYLSYLQNDPQNPALHKLKKAFAFPAVSKWRKQMGKAAKTPTDGDAEYLKELFQ